MDDIINDFLTETKEGLERLDNEIVELEKFPDKMELIGSIFRVMHTIKGTCGFLGLERLEKIAHAGENLMDKFRSNSLKITPHKISIILKAIDKIKEIINSLEQSGKEPEGEDLELINLINQESLSQAPQAASAQILEGQAEKIEAQKNIKDNSHALEHHAAQTIRVSVDVLEQLMQVVSELVLNRNQLLQINRSVKNSHFTSAIQRLDNITSELQENVMKTRMQPIGTAWSKFPRIVRDLANELGKKVNLVMIGEDTELDRQLIELIKDPLTHMVRNSVDHGLEFPDARLAANKSETGTITLKAYHQGGHIIIEISDDGRGLDIEKIKNKMLEKELATIEEVNDLTDQQIMQYIFMPGFSTADKITSISGRGVGMDVVKNNIEKISGTIELSSSEGKGSSFKIKIPLTLAIIPILIIEAGDLKFGIPQINVNEMVRVGKTSEHQIENINGRKLLRLRGELLPLINLSAVLNISNDEPTVSENIFIVVFEVSGNNFGLIVDKIFDTEEIVVKPVSPLLKSIGIYSGNTILGNGQVIMILDPVGIIRNTDNLLMLSPDSKEQHNAKFSKQDNISSFLIIKNNKVNNTIPLELVSRLEEIDVKQIEYANNKPVIQYRGSLMYLTKLDPNYALPETGMVEVVVFVNQRQILGLIVEEIIDITEQAIIDSSLEDSGFNAIVIKGKTTDLIDVNSLFEKTFGCENQAITQAEQPTKNSHQPKILFIDDSPFFRKFIPALLMEKGYNVISADSAFNALDILEKDQDINLVVTDINMPEMDGHEFSNKCKIDKRFKNLPIIALTSNNEEDINEATLKKYHLAAYVTKTNHAELVDIIEANLGRGQ